MLQYRLTRPLVRMLWCSNSTLTTFSSIGVTVKSTCLGLVRRSDNRFPRKKQQDRAQAQVLDRVRVWAVLTLYIIYRKFLLAFLEPQKSRMLPNRRGWTEWKTECPPRLLSHNSRVIMPAQSLWLEIRTRAFEISCQDLVGSLLTLVQRIQGQWKRHHHQSWQLRRQHR